MKGWRLHKTKVWPIQYDYINVNLENTAYVVEANSYEVLALWREIHEERKWVQKSKGVLETIGELKIGKKWFPVCLDLHWNVIDKQMVMFYDPCSRMVDYTMVEEWLKLHCSPTCPVCGRPCKCNAMNFGHCLGCIDHLNGKK